LETRGLPLKIKYRIMSTKTYLRGHFYMAKRRTFLNGSNTPF
jgi:hypothetical protein